VSSALSAYDAGVLSASRELADFFEATARALRARQGGRQLDRQ
jgi:hypothetical protein